VRKFVYKMHSGCVHVEGEDDLGQKRADLSNNN